MNIVDRRNNPKGRSTGNRQKFLKRVDGQIKKALPSIVGGKSMKDLTSGKGKIKVPIKGLEEPEFVYDPKTGKKNIVSPGNKSFDEGDTIPKPHGGYGRGGRKGSRDAEETEDEFFVTISMEEFADYFFADLELPNMVKKYLQTVDDFQRKRAGYIQDGMPSRLNVVKSYQNSLARKFALKAYYEKRIKELKDELNVEVDSDKIVLLEEEIKRFEKLANSVPYMDDIDLRYNHYEKLPIPTTSAVMVCVMDVSGSMGEEEKDISKRYFLLLYMFLKKQYERVELVFIRHHTEAKEVTEEEFFDSRESGGTIVAPSLQLAYDIIQERYKGYNAYLSQCTDGDVFGEEDAEECYQTVTKKLLPTLQYMTYIQIMRGENGELWEYFKAVSEEYDNFAMRSIDSLQEIWPVFKDLFTKRIT